MQYSKSFAYFAPSEPQRQASTQTRAQRRSSLDTFVIPGRTRLPSSKASTFDLQVTQGLLNTNRLQPQGVNMTSAEIPEWSPKTSSAGCMPRRGAILGPSGPPHHRVRPEMVKRPPPRFGGREVIIVPPQRPQPHVRQPAPRALTPISSQDDTNPQTYDGADDSPTESRLTSTTWSTVSHRIFTDSSGSSRTMGASYYRDEYNKLAQTHGLPQLEAVLDDDENHSQTKTTTKSHHAGWLARKLFRRSSSIYTLKAKTTYKPIAKKKSFGGIPVLSEDCRKVILKGKSLEQLGRLGGLSVLVLPSNFAVDKLTLPTCLSATATYLLEHGRNAPGIFRVSGQTTIVNALYDFYDHQFANTDAGSPSKVEQTVGSGLLPSHIEHTVPDVASFFKRVLIDLPGGLLGSVELFEVLRNITTSFDPELSQSDLASLKAKMVALAISSVASDYRLYLIQAVLGLVSYLGHEAEKLQAQTDSTDDDQASLELMNYRSLGVVLGPLLLGTLTDRALHGSGEGHTGAQRVSFDTDSAGMFRKHKRKQSDMKLDQNATLAAFVDRANRTAIVMQQLLSMWPDVVKELRQIGNTSSSSLKPGVKRRLQKPPSRTGSRLTMDTSEDETRFFDILRGHTLPEELQGTVKMKSNIRMTSRSPMSRGAIGPSEDGNPHDTWLPAASEEFGSPNSGHSEIAEHAARDNEIAVNTELRSMERTNMLLADDTTLRVENRTPSDDAMEQMAMGTILPPLQVQPSYSPRKDFLRIVDPATETPRKTRKSSPSSKTPETALRDVPPAKRGGESEESQLEICMRKPLPPIRDTQRAERSFSTSEDNVLDPPPRLFANDEFPVASRHNTPSSKSSRHSFSSRKARQSGERTVFPSRQSGQWQWPSSPTKQRDEKAIFPPRQSSLPMEKHLAIKPIETYATVAEYKAEADTYMSPPTFNIPTSEAQMEQIELPNGGPKSNKVKLLAQRFAEASRATRGSSEQAKETAIPRIYAIVNALPSPKSPMLGLDDPFFSVESNNVSKESLIPKPVREVGRSRERRSLSPPKRAVPKTPASKRHSAFSIVMDRDAEIVKNNTVSSPPATPNTGEGEIYDEMITNPNGIGFSKQPLTQLLDAYHHHRSAESLQRIRTSLQDSPPGSRRIHNRSISFADLARPDSPSLNIHGSARRLPPRSNSFLTASDALKPLERHASINATMYSEICRLQRLLQHMGEEKEAKDRRIEALEEVQGGIPVATGLQARGSFGKGGLLDEVRKAKTELNFWKSRAVLAEKRLSGFEQRSGKPWESEVVDSEYEEPTKRPEFVEMQDEEKEMGSVGYVQADSPDMWKRRGIVAEGQLAHNFSLTDNGPHGEMVRRIPSPLTAKVYVAVETQDGKKKDGTWHWRGGSSDTVQYSRSNSEEEKGRRTSTVKMRRGSDDGISGVASPVNGFG